MRVVAVQQLALQVRQRANLSGQQNAFGSNTGGNVTDVEMLSMLNASVAEYLDILILKYGDNYWWSVYLLPIVQGVYSYQLPFDFYKENGVDLALDTTLQNWASVTPYTQRDRNQFSYPLQTVLAYAGWQNLRWQIQGQALDFLPKLGPMPGNVRLQYAPQAPTLCATFPTAYATATAYAQNALTYASVSVNGETANIVFMALNAGTSGSMPPSWVFPGTVQDNNILWASQGPLSSYQTTLDGVNGYEDYVVLDCAIKCLAKRQQDASEFMAQKQALLARIELAAANRASGDPMVVAGGFGQLEGGPGYGNGFGFWGGW